MAKLGSMGGESRSAAKRQAALANVKKAQAALAAKRLAKGAKAKRGKDG